MTSWKRLLLLSATLAVVIFATACGGGDDDEGSSAGQTSGPTIKLGFSAWPGWFPWQVAEEQGIFKQAGVNVELVYFEGYLDSINALAAGQLDANSQTLNDTLASVAAGSDQRIVLVNDNSTGNDQIIVKSDINSVADLRGKKIGVEAGVVDHFLLALGLEKAGLSLDDVEIENLETGAAAASFAAGQLDAVGAFAPFTTNALKRSGSKVLFSSKDFPGSIPDHLVVSGEFIDKNPEVVQKLVNSWFMTMDYLKANQDKSIEIMAKRAGVSVSEYKEYDAGTTLFTHAQNVSAFGDGPNITHLPFAAKEIAAFMLENGFVEKEFDYSKVFAPQFVKAYSAEKS